MKRTLLRTILTIAVILLPLCISSAEEQGFQGEVTLKGTLADVNGDTAKFNEYRDIHDTLTGDLFISYRNDKYFLKLNSRNVAQDNQKYTLSGGMWGKFSYKLFYNEIPHNITFGARTFFSGAGGPTLTGVPTPLSSWSSFDYSTERKRYGAGLRLDLLNPFFLDMSVQREDKKGIKPASGDVGDFSSFTELPEPVDYRTDAFRAEAGYSKKPFFASLSYYYSKFSNDNQALDFANPFTGPDSLTLPPDNRYDKISFKAAVFLPYRSKLSLNMGKAKAKSEGDANTVIGVSAFDGRVDTKNMDLVLTSNPVSFLDGRVFYKYFDRDNKSDDTAWGFGYTDRSLGGQLGFRLPADFRLTVGYTSKNTSYEDRTDAHKRKDNAYSADLTWSGLDFAVFKIGYENMHRSLDRKGSSDVWKYDVAPFNRDTVKASVDLFPVDNLSLTLGYKYKRTDYNRSELGLKEDKRDAFFADASYALAKVARIYGYFDYEKVRSYQAQFSSSSPTTGWNLRQQEKNYDYGIGADVYIMPRKLTLKLKYDYIRSNGSADYTLATLLPGWTNSNVDISNWGDYRKTALSARVIYDVMKPLTITVGYAYEQFKLDDFQLDGYQYTTTSAYLTGAYKDQNYRANVVFLALTYRF